MNTLTLRINAVALTLAAQIFVSCHDHGITPDLPGDYFPLPQNSQTTYIREFISTGEASVLGTDTLTLHIATDTVIEGQSYQKILDGDGVLEKVVRRDGTQYFGRNHELYGGFTKEYMFLDESLLAGDKWEYLKNEGVTKTEYVVKEVNATVKLSGVEYTDVIKLEVNYYDNFTDGETLELRYSTSHYYAKGVGEIYAYYPYPASQRYCDLRISIFNDLK